MAKQTYQWTCPGCDRTFRIPVGRSEPKICKACRERLKAEPKSPSPVSDAPPIVTNPEPVSPIGTSYSRQRRRNSLLLPVLIAGGFLAVGAALIAGAIWYAGNQRGEKRSVAKRDDSTKTESAKSPDAEQSKTADDRGQQKEERGTLAKQKETYTGSVALWKTSSKIKFHFDLLPNETRQLLESIAARIDKGELRCTNPEFAALDANSHLFHQQKLDAWFQRMADNGPFKKKLLQYVRIPPEKMSRFNRAFGSLNRREQERVFLMAEILAKQGPDGLLERDKRFVRLHPVLFGLD